MPLQTRYFFASGRNNYLPPKNIKLLLEKIRKSKYLTHITISNIDTKPDHLVVTIKTENIPEDHVSLLNELGTRISLAEYVSGQDLYEDIDIVVREYERETGDNLFHSQYKYWARKSNNTKRGKRKQTRKKKRSKKSTKKSTKKQMTKKKGARSRSKSRK